MDAIEKRLQLWEKGQIRSLLLKVETILQRLTSNNDLKNIFDVSETFAELMGKGNFNGALKLLTNNMKNGILPLYEIEKVLNSLKQKHPQSKRACEETLINSGPPVIHLIIFDDINEELVRKAAIRTTGGSTPPGLDADGWRKMLASEVFVSCTSIRYP